MAHPRYSSDEIVERGQALYDQRIREQVEPRYTGKFLVLDIETGEFEIDADSVAALERATAKHPDPALYLLRVGFPTAVSLGAWFWVR
jgi:hypothetical protein